MPQRFGRQEPTPKRALRGCFGIYSASVAVPLVGEEFVGVHSVGVVVGDGGDVQFVGAGDALECVEFVGDGAW